MILTVGGEMEQTSTSTLSGQTALTRVSPAQDVVDVAKLAKEVIPRNTYFRRPLLYTD